MGAKHSHKELTLYDRLGGIYGIAAVVDDFSDRILKNGDVGRGSGNPQLREWSNKKSAERLAGLKWLRTLWLAEVAGGPYKFVATKPGKCPLSLENAHSEFKITSHEFSTVADILTETLQDHGVNEKDRSLVLAAFAAHRPEVTENKPPAKC